MKFTNRRGILHGEEPFSSGPMQLEIIICEADKSRGRVEHYGLNEG